MIRHRHMSTKKHWLPFSYQSLFRIVVLLCSVSISGSLSGQTTLTSPERDTINDTTIVILDEPADQVRLFTRDSVQYQQLVGNVRMRHDSTFFRTDSAILDDRNQVEAYGN